MARSDVQAECSGVLGTFGYSFDLLFDLACLRPKCRVSKFGIARCAYFDLVRAHALGRFNLSQEGIYESADQHSARGEPINCAAQLILVGYHIEPAFGGYLVGPFGDESRGIRHDLHGQLYHLVGRSHLEVQVGFHDSTQQSQILILDVTPISAQVNRDAAGTRHVHKYRCCDDARFVGQSGLANRCNVVNIDVQPYHGAVEYITSDGDAWSVILEAD